MKNGIQLTESQIEFLLSKARLWTAEALIHTQYPETEMVIAAEELSDNGFLIADDSNPELTLDAEQTYKLMETYGGFNLAFFELVLDTYTEMMGGIIRVNDILWDTDGVVVDLPQNLEVMPRDMGMSARELQEMYDEDGCLDIENYMLDVLADYLSEETGFCHEGFSIAA